jgi:hypothetical protein
MQNNSWDDKDEDEIEEIEEVDNKGKRRKQVKGIKMEDLGEGRYRFTTTIKCPDANCEKCKKLNEQHKPTNHPLVVEIYKATTK